ncbi:MAG TPA: hypothetical protein PLT15_05310 [Bacilli bacterium]|nr:hypothetical protein [Bacilli bacterium]
MDLIKSLFLPSKMNRHRHMSGFMAVMIFLACAFVLTIPTTVRIEKEKYNLVDEFGMSFLTEIPDTEDTNKIMQLKDYGCSVKEGKLVCENEEIIPIAKKDDAVKEAFMISYVVKVAQKDGSSRDVVRNIYFVFDFYQAKPQYNVNTDFDDKERKDNEVNYLVYITKEFMAIRLQPQVDKNGNKLNTITHEVGFTDYGFSTDELGNTPLEAGKYLGYLFLNAYIPFYKRNISYTTVISIFVLNLIVIALVWLLSRSFGRLKNFKEYYGIASICFIPIAIIFFIVLWFIPVIEFSTILLFLNSAFALYYLFMIFKINNLSEVV